FVCRRVFRWLLFDRFVKNGEAEDRVFARSGNGDGDYGASALLFENRVEWLQEDRFHPAYNLREFRLQTKLTAEVQLTAIQIVGAVQKDGGSFHTKLEMSERGDAIFHVIVALQVSRSAPGVFLVGFAEAVTAEGSKLGTDLRIGEAGTLNAKIAIEEKFVEGFFFAGREDKLGLQLDGADHERLLRFNGEGEDVLQASLRGDDIQGDEMPLLFGNANDTAIGDEERLAENGAHRMKVGCAIGAIDGGGKRGAQRYAASDRIEGERRCIGFALDFNLVELAQVLSSGRENARDAG